MISDLVLGTMYFGTRTDQETSFALLDAFVDAGGTTLDTANCYAFWVSESGGGGQSEALLGDWFRANLGVRDRVTLTTKVGAEPATPGDFTVEQGLSPAVVRREAERSLERLGTDRIDLYWAHVMDRHTPIEETVDALGELVREGRATRLGISNHPTWMVERARAHAAARGQEPFTALQLSTSYVERRPGAEVEGKANPFGWVTEETLHYVDVHPEIELWAYSPLIQGSFDRDDRPFPQAYEHRGTSGRLAVLDEVARRFGVERSTVVLAWLTRHGIRPILGVSTPEQLRSALAAGDLELDREVMGQLDAPR